MAIAQMRGGLSLYPAKTIRPMHALLRIDRFLGQARAGAQDVLALTRVRCADQRHSSSFEAIDISVMGSDHKPSAGVGQSAEDQPSDPRTAAASTHFATPFLPRTQSQNYAATRNPAAAKCALIRSFRPLGSGSAKCSRTWYQIPSPRASARQPGAPMKVSLPYRSM